MIRDDYVYVYLLCVFYCDWRHLTDLHQMQTQYTLINITLVIVPSKHY